VLPLHGSLVSAHTYTISKARLQCTLKMSML
jgi:hypothetical protein